MGYEVRIWNTVYLERATEQVAKSRQFEPALLQHVSPARLGTHQSHRRLHLATNKRVAKGGFRPLRNPRTTSSAP